MAGIFPIILLVTISNFCEGQNVQSWLDNNARVKIVFSHEPSIPSINNFTQLNFIVKNISTGEPIKDLIGRISITNGGGLYKFENISGPSGNFSVRYIFPTDGTYQVFTKVQDKNFLKEFASFKIFVPVQGSQSVLDLLWSNKMYLLIVIIGASLGVLVTRGFFKKRKLA